MRTQRAVGQAPADGSTIGPVRRAVTPAKRAVPTVSLYEGDTSVWLIDAHPLMRAGLKAQLDGKGFKIVAEGGSLSEVFEKSADGLPQLIVVDMNLGLAVLGDVKSSQPDARVVVLAEHAELSHLVDAFSAGADGYLLKSISTNALVESLRLVVMGEKVFPGVVTNYLSMLGATNGDHERVRMSSSSVRLAFETSVACTAPAADVPPVRFQSSHESIVPNATSGPGSTPPSRKIHASFVAEK